MKKTLMTGMAAITMLSSPITVAAESPKWHNVNVNETTQEEDESLFNSENYDFLKYSKVEDKLREIAKHSKRITMESSAKSSGGHDLYTVTISDPTVKGKYGYQKSLRKKMFKNPEKAQTFIENHPDFKVPVMINASIHGTEFVGSDAALQLIERFATANDQETKELLENHILIFNVVANPDGRIDATRFNSNGIDLNRDFITQSQAETKHTVELIKEWNPMVFLDLHGYVKSYGGPDHPGLIEPCTPPHNPNYEYDLFSKWALDQAEAMEGSIVENRADYENTNTDVSGVDYQSMTGTYIPQRDDQAGWDDYPPIFTPMYAMYHGAYGYTLEAPTNDWDGVQWHYDAVMGALEFSNDNKEQMIKDQIEVFKRGIQFDHPYHTEGFFPQAYILSGDETDSTATEKAVEHLMFNDIDVSESKKAFEYDGVSYPAGTYIVDMSQAKAGLANTMLWDGEDITDLTPSMYDISAWNLPELWGFEAVEVKADSSFNVKTSDVKKVKADGELTGNGPYVIPNSSVKAINLVNTLVKNGFRVTMDGKQFYVDANKSPELRKLVEASGITVKSIEAVDGEPLTSQKVTILKDGGMNKGQSHAGALIALERLGFEVQEITPRELAEQGLGDTEVFFYSGTSNLISYNNSPPNAEFGLGNEAQYNAFKENIHSFVEDGGKYIAVGAGASDAAKQLGLTDVTVHKGGYNSNGIVRVNYDSVSLTSGYGETDYGFVYHPVWYTDVEGTDVHATYKDSRNFFMAGHWEDRADAQGQPVIIKEQDQDVTLIGLEAGFRDHTDYLFRLFSNAIYNK
ncbi:Zinc carboxypeptidase [Halobacillus karajensis]|uniref:Zinc carboxypeptidase n=1 Tax=Halobacillus karajensis TaxID=195088 RepID=A0A024P965_9BACI|nr:M14 family zinc carboxypeptidase [Halobacillus karajensis]CDQ21271.1 Zinc carboxypeptidase [Halobacillus karajensis]CDQ25659.1 Zinc carboxypeptidase [Halobacillus karajensis]CDQ25930.1 Zinc carboxypeptidase [Halobacillus karajensis]SEI10229.1 Zinc carboxypeptidase [Halobacillus karajensis]